METEEKQTNVLINMQLAHKCALRYRFEGNSTAYSMYMAYNILYNCFIIK